MRYCVYSSAREKGYSTLLLTSMILLIVLVVSLSSFRSITQYYRIAQHRLVSMQNQWQAEGAVECVFAQSKVSGLFPLDGEGCDQDVDELSVTGNILKRVHAQRGFSALSKQLTLPMAETSGAIKTSANLIFRYSAKFEPDPGETNADADWKCVAIRYKHQLVAPSLTTYHPYEMERPPYSGFPDSSEYQQHCATTNYSDHVSASYTKADYLHDETMDPFSDLFGVDSSQWFDVLAMPEVGRVPDSLNVAGEFAYSSKSLLPQAVFVEDCAEQIVQRIKQGKDLIWVYGGCELKERDISQINLAIQTTFPQYGIILVVQNGLLAIESQQMFSGLVMQFTSSDAGILPLGEWDQTTLADEVNQAIAEIANPALIDSAQINYYQVGRFNPVGGLLLSSDNAFAIIEGQLDFHYQRDVIARALGHVRPVHWRMSSWSDGALNAE